MPDEHGIPLEGVAPVWERMGPAAREQYEREHGVKPPGYRGTGPVEWFGRHHPDFGPCIECGRQTERWEIRETYIGTGGLPSATYNNHALCGPMVALCWPCERARCIATLERRQQNMAIDESVRAGEAKYLAELKAEQGEAVAA